jgi:hypothetical protein
VSVCGVIDGICGRIPAHLYYKTRTNDVDPAMFPTQLLDLEQNVISGIQAETRPLGSVSRILVFKDLKDSSRLPARYRSPF